MPEWTRKRVVPGDRLTVESQHTTRSAVRPLIGLLRTVEILDNTRAVIVNEDGTRYTVHGRRLPPVALVEVSIFTDPTIGDLWAHVYELPPREHSPYPLPPRYAAVAESDGHGGIARLRSCWCGGECVCPTCGEQTVKVPTTSGLEWSTRSCSGGRHAERLVCPLVVPHNDDISDLGRTRVLRFADEARTHRLGVQSGIRAPTPLPLTQPVGRGSPCPRQRCRAADLNGGIDPLNRSSAGRS